MLERIKFLVSPVPSYMIFWVTQNCNARCAFCFNWEENLKKNRDLSIDEIRRLAENYPHLKYLTLAGGEPTLRKDLPEIVDAFVTGAGLQMCSIVTNGFQWQRMLKAADAICTRHGTLGLNIGVSIDFIGEEHDKHRVLEGCFDGCVRIIQGVKEMRARHPNLMVGAVGTYTKANADSILDTARKIMTTYQIPFSMNLIRGQVEDPALKEIDAEHYYATARRILEIEERTIPRTTIDAPFRFALEEMAVDNIYKSLTTGQMQIPCQAGRKAIVLESNGKLRLCEILPDDFGNIRDYDYDIPEMLREKEAMKVIDWVQDSKCHCTWECFNRANIVFDARKWPKLVSTAGRKALHMRQ